MDVVACEQAMDLEILLFILQFQPQFGNVQRGTLPRARRRFASLRVLFVINLYDNFICKNGKITGTQ